MANRIFGRDGSAAAISIAKASEIHPSAATKGGLYQRDVVIGLLSLSQIPLRPVIDRSGQRPTAQVMLSFGQYSLPSDTNESIQDCALHAGYGHDN